MKLDFPRYVNALQKMNIVLFGVLGVQMIVIPLIIGFQTIDYFPPAFIFFAVCGAWLVSNHFYHSRAGKVFFLASSIVTIFLTVYYVTIFSGPFDRMLQVVYGFSLVTNAVGIGGIIVLPILELVKDKTGKLREVTIIMSEPRKPSEARIAKGYKWKSIMVFGFFIGAFVLFPLAMFDFGRVYTVQAPDSATTRSSFWGPPYYNSTTIATNITPVDADTLYIENASITSPLHNLRPGSIMYVNWVHNGSNTTVNYCDYLQGARSFPNGSVFLSQSLPSLSNVSISFVYMRNVEVYEYLDQLGSRVIHSEGGGNRSWIESPNLFDNIDKTYGFLLMEYWNISYFINIAVEGYVFTNIYNYSPFTTRAIAMLDWINASRPHMDHCIGIAYDLEPKEVKPPEMNPDRPDIGEYPENPLISEEKWIRLNEQNDEVLQAAKAAYFNVFDHANELGMGTYLTFVNYGMEDLAEGDIDYTRLPLWRHPDVEYGMMSYQSKDSDAEAMWRIYAMNKNQQQYYGDQGYSLLTGWLTFDEEVHLPYYSNDQAGLDRYIRDIKLHQACGAKEVVHAPLWDLLLKWGGADVMLEFDKALNTEPKEKFVFRAHPWGNFDTTMYDVAENYNKWWIAIPVLAVQAVFLVAGIIPRKKRE